MTRKVCVVTGSRAEYGLLRWVMEGIKASRSLELQVVVTGAHLSDEFGTTRSEIEGGGFAIDDTVDLELTSDTPEGIARSIGLGFIGFGKTWKRLKPDIILVLGDRYEILAAAGAALVANVPVAHLHGGERTEGAIDEALRHSITKMSHLHFVAAEDYRRRVIQLGEAPETVFVVGGLGVDAISKLRLLDREELERELGVTLGKRSLMITFHPVTLEGRVAGTQVRELLAALEPLTDTTLIFTMPNADPDGRIIAGMIQEFVDAHSNARAYVSLGQLRYLSCLRQVDGIVGNSSSGLTEAPALHKGTVNIGDRQRGRLAAESVIDCEPDRESISAAIERLRSPGFQKQLASVRSPYGQPGASDSIVRILATQPLEGIVKKRFHDLS